MKVDEEEEVFIAPNPVRSFKQVEAEEALAELLKDSLKYVPNEILDSQKVKSIKIDEFSTIPILSEKDHIKQKEIM